MLSSLLLMYVSFCGMLCCQLYDFGFTYGIVIQVNVVEAVIV